MCGVLCVCVCVCVCVCACVCAGSYAAPRLFLCSQSGTHHRLTCSTFLVFTRRMSSLCSLAANLVFKAFNRVLSGTVHCRTIYRIVELRFCIEIASQVDLLGKLGGGSL